MIELMVVLVALSILVAMVVGIGSQMADEQNRTMTRGNQMIVIGAIETYRQIQRADPPDLHSCAGGDGHSPPFNSSTTGYGNNEYWRMMTLTMALSQVPECVDVYSQTESFKMDQRFAGIAVIGIFNDAYGRCMDWDGDGGFGNSPAIISAGPDGFFGHHTLDGTSPTTIEDSEGPTRLNRKFEDDRGLYLPFQLEAQEDNIRSDGKTQS